MLKNTETRYGWITILFHWIMAIIIIGMLCLGLYMTNLPINDEKIKLYGIHKEIGVIVLVLACLRLGWRFANIEPSLPIASWQKWAARSVHWALYFFMIFMPITGWFMSSAAGFPVSFFGLFTLPDFISPNENTRVLFLTLHVYSAFILIGLIFLHVGAALHHHFVHKNNILRRMLWS